MNILIAAPTEREYDYMATAIAEAGETRHTYTLIRCGVGKAAAAAAVSATVAAFKGRPNIEVSKFGEHSDNLFEAFPPLEKGETPKQPFDAIAVIGFAAGTADFKQGDIAIPSAARYHDCNVPDGFVPELTDPYKLFGTDNITVFTGDSFVDADIVRDIKRRFGIKRAIFDMEIDAIAIAADICGKIPVIAVKMISDVPEAGHNDQSYEEFADRHSDFGPILEKIEAL